MLLGLIHQRLDTNPAALCSEVSSQGVRSCESPVAAPLGTIQENSAALEFLRAVVQALVSLAIVGTRKRLTTMLAGKRFVSAVSLQVTA